MVMIKSEEDLEELTDEVFDEVVDDIQVKKTVKQLKKEKAEKKESNIVNFIQATEQEQPDKFSKLDHNEIVSGALNTKFGSQVDSAIGRIVFKFAQMEDAPEREIQVKVKVNNDDSEHSHKIILGGMEFSKFDFKEIYSIFDILCEQAVKQMVVDFNNKKDPEQMNLFPESLQDSYLSEVTITVNLFNHLKGETVMTPITISSTSGSNFAFKVDKKNYLTKSDIYLFYCQFENIVSRILNKND